MVASILVSVSQVLSIVSVIQGTNSTLMEEHAQVSVRL